MILRGILSCFYSLSENSGNIGRFYFKQFHFEMAWSVCLLSRSRHLSWQTTLILKPQIQLLIWKGTMSNLNIFLCFYSFRTPYLNRECSLALIYKEVVLCLGYWFPPHGVHHPNICPGPTLRFGWTSDCGMSPAGDWAPWARASSACSPLHL